MYFSWTVTPSFVGQTVLHFLKVEQEFSKRLIKLLKRTTNGIQVNGEDVTVRKKLHLNDVIVVRIKEERTAAFISKDIPLDIVYEDENFLVVYKEAGLLTIPSKHSNESLANGLLYYYDQQDLPYTVHIVTRLDKDTSGLVLVAKHSYAHYRISKLQKKFEIDRTYEALVYGNVIADYGTIDLPISRDLTSLIRRQVAKDGQFARTHFKTIMRRSNWSLLELRLETGRTHQIRVHLAELGYPIIGDELYGPCNNQKHHRHYLHCKRLSFVDPFTNKRRQFDTRQLIDNSFDFTRNE